MTVNYCDKFSFYAIIQQGLKNISIQLATTPGRSGRDAGAPGKGSIYRSDPDGSPPQPEKTIKKPLLNIKPKIFQKK